jgi:hypothetical protein
MSPKIKRYTEQLPSTAVTPQMREEMEQLKQAKRMSLADLQREAIAFFLRENYSFAIGNNSEAVEESA